MMINITRGYVGAPAVTARAVLKAAPAGATRRPAPTVVIFVVLAVGSAAVLLGLATAVVVLVMAVRIIASVAAASVVAGHRRIAVLRSVGFTPAQVTAIYLIQIGLPALAGAIAGTALGGQVVLPLINSGHFLFNIDVAAPLWASFVVPPGMLALTLLAAAVPALRAGRQPALAGAGDRAHCYRAAMSIPLSDAALRLVDGKNYAVLATVNPDGSPQTSVIWVGRDAGDLLFSTVEGRVKHRNMVADPRVSVTVIDSADPENYVELRGRVSMTFDVDRQIDTQLSWKYDGRDPGQDRPGAVRVVVRMIVEKATGYAA